MKNGTQLIQQILHYATLPGAAGLFCVIIFMSGERRRGRLMFLSLSLAVSLNLLMKEFFKVPRPWWPDVSTAPYLAEGGYALPCLHTMLTAALLGTFALSSSHKAVRFLCSAGICITAAWRIMAGLQSTADVLAGLACGLIIAFLICRFSFRTLKKTSGIVTASAALLSGLAAAVLFQDGWGLGAGLTAVLLELTEAVFRKADSGRTTFGKIYGTVFAAGIYSGLIIFLPFLIEWLITPLWPGQTLIVLLITFIPCLLKLFPVF